METGDGASTLFGSILRLFRHSVGDFIFDHAGGSRHWRGLVTLIFVAWTLVANMLLFNMLIGLMTNTFNLMLEDSERTWRLQWARIILLMERRWGPHQMHTLLLPAWFRSAAAETVAAAADRVMRRVRAFLPNELSEAPAAKPQRPDAGRVEDGLGLLEDEDEWEKDLPSDAADAPALEAAGAGAPMGNGHHAASAGLLNGDHRAPVGVGAGGGAVGGAKAHPLQQQQQHHHPQKVHTVQEIDLDFGEGAGVRVVLGHARPFFLAPMQLMIIGSPLLPHSSDAELAEAAGALGGGGGSGR